MKKTILIAVVAAAIVFIIFIFYNNQKSGTVVWSHISNPSFSNTWPYALAINNSNVYIVGKNYLSGRNDQWIIEKRSLSDGSLVKEFGESGVITSNPGAGSHGATAIAIDSSYLYVVGNGVSPHWRIEKRNLFDGTLVVVFGKGGVVTSYPTEGYSYEVPKAMMPKAIVIDDKFMYVAGLQIVANALERPNYRSDYQWRIEKRKLSDGALIHEFGDEGVITSNPSTIEGDTGGEGVNAIAIDSNFIYVVGKDNSADIDDQQWRIEKRKLSDGSLDVGFGNNGVVTSNPSAYFDEARSLAVDSEFLYVVGHDTAPGSNAQWRIEKRMLSSGSLVEEFGNNGVITSNPSSGVDWAYSIALEKEYSIWKQLINLDFVLNQKVIYIAGKDSSPGPKDSQWRLEKRNSTDGSLISKFGNEGILNINPSTAFDSVYDIVIDKSHIYILGTKINKSHKSNKYSWRIVKITK